jgi:hypothetical protein
MLKMMDDVEPILQALRGDALTDQEALLLHRLCVLPSITHVLRTAYPSDAKVLAAAMDEATDNLLHRRGLLQAGDANESTARRQAALPLRLGGAGLTKQTDLVNIAFLSGVAQAVDQLINMQDVATNNTRLQNEVNACLDENSPAVVGGAQEREILPKAGALSDTLKFLQERKQRIQAEAEAAAAGHDPGGGRPKRPERTQHVLTNLLHEHNAEQLKQQLPPTERGRLLDVQQRTVTSTAWLNTCPTDRLTRLHNREFRIAFRTRLGLDPLPLRNHNDRACDCDSDLRRAPSHIFSCNQLMHSEINNRHDQVALAVTAKLRAYGAQVIPEPPMLSDEDGKRPDHMIRYPGGAVIITDITIVNPITKTAIANGTALRKDEVRLRAEKAKAEKYAHLAREIDATMVPLAFSVFGASSREHLASLLPESIHKAMEESTAGGILEARNDFFSAISVAIQSSQAQLIMSAAAKARINPEERSRIFQRAQRGRGRGRGRGRRI